MNVKDILNIVNKVSGITADDILLFRNVVPKFNKYEPPMSLDKLPDVLKKDIIHAWRAESGIELIHKEPSLSELYRIKSNWDLMDDNMKKQSDNKSIDLFKMDNITHFNKLLLDRNYTDYGTFKPIRVNNNGFTVVKSEWTLQSKIVLNPGDVLNLTKKIETTIGRMIANRLLKIDPFGKFFEFDNSTLHISDFINRATGLLMSGEVTSEQMVILFNNAVWLTRFADMILPSLSKNILVTPKETVELKNTLMEEYKDAIKAGDVSTFCDKVEKPLLLNIVKNLKDDPSYTIYTSTGKPNVTNHLKNCISTFSPIFNPTTGKFDISTGNLLEGHDVGLYGSMANMNINGTYSRAVDTQNGGAIVKSLYNSMCYIKAGIAGSDCNATIFKTVKLVKGNSKLYLWNYMVEGRGLVLLTPTNIVNYLGKICKFRSVLYCKYEVQYELCNKCCGEIPYKTNLLAVGSLCARVGFNFVKSSLKTFHDSTIKLTDYNPFNFMKIEV